MRVFVTGASGFVGTNLVLELASRGHEIVGYDGRSPKQALPMGVRFVSGDLLDRDGLERALTAARPDVVFHLGARTDLHGRTPDDYKANSVGTMNLISSLKSSAQAPYVVYASSRLVFAIDHKPASLFDYKPSTPYGASKIEMEQIVLREASAVGAWTIVRPTSLWGPFFDVPYRDFFDAVRAGRYVNPGGRSPRKSFGFVGNAVYELIVLAESSDQTRNEQVLWLSDYDPLELGSWSQMIAAEFGVRGPRTVPLPLLKAAASAGDLARRLGYKEPPLTSFRLDNLLTDMVYDTAATRALVGSLPFSLQDGVRRTVRWMRDGSLER